MGRFFNKDKKDTGKVEYKLSTKLGIIAFFFILLISIFIFNAGDMVYRAPKNILSNLDSLSTAVYVYRDRIGVWPGQRADGTFSVKDTYDALIKEGYMSEKFPKVYKTLSRNKYFVFAPCKSEVTDNGSYFIWHNDNMSESGMCMIFMYTPEDIRTVADLHNSGFSGVDVCYLESSYDDENVKGGAGRILLYPGAKKEDFGIDDINPEWNCSYQKSQGKALNYAIMLSDYPDKE